MALWNNLNKLRSRTLFTIIYFIVHFLFFTNNSVKKEIKLERLATGKDEKVDSLHVPAMKFIGKKRLI